MSTKELKVIFKDVGSNDHMPYLKADIIKISRISNNFSLSFYQIDYQALAVRGKNLNIDDSSNNIESEDYSKYLIAVGKIVLDESGFGQLINEVDQLKKMLSNQK